MSSLLPDGFDGLKVLDAFAGSGALGLEALSRGAENVVFCEINRMAVKTLRANIDTLKIASERYSVLQSDIFAERTLSGLERSKPFDAVFLDPPYALSAKRVFALVKSLSTRKLLAEGCIISYEHAVEKAPTVGSFGRKSACVAGQVPCDTYNDGPVLVSCKTYGSTVIEYLEKT